MIAAAAAVLLAACSTKTKRRLGQHIFEVPEAYNVADDDAPFFLPALDPSDGFSFYLNPAAALPDRVLVGVASKDRMCARAAGTEARINSTVCASRPLAWRRKPLRKFSDSAFWTYDLPLEASRKQRTSRASLASCYAMAESAQPGLCMANLRSRADHSFARQRDEPVGRTLRTICEQVARVGTLRRNPKQSPD